MDLVDGEVHAHEAGGVPQLVGEVTGGLDLLVGEAHIVSGGVTRSQGEAESVRAVVGDDLQRIDAVAQRLGHLTALGVAHQTVDEDGIEGHLTRVLQGGEDHTGDPEGDDIVAGNQGVGGVEVSQILGLLGPAQSGEGPEGGGEPGVQSIGILGHGAAALGAGGATVGSYLHVAAGIAVVGGNAVTPPELTGDAPILAVLHPVEVVLVEALGDEAGLALADGINGGLGQRLHADEPLEGDHGLDGGAATVAGTHLMLQILDLGQEAALAQVIDDGLTSLVAIHTGVLGIVVGDLGAVGQHDLHGQVATAANLEVVGVMGGGDLHAAGTLVQLGVLVGHDGNAAAHQRQDDVLTDQILVALVGGVDGHGGIAQQGLGTGGSHLHVSAAAHQGVTDVPEMAVLLLVVHLGVGDGGLAVGAPVDDALAAVDQTLLVEAAEDLADGLGAALVQGEALTAPVAGGAHLLQLGNDAVAVLLLPLPGALQELLTAEVFLGQTFLAHGLHDLGLGGDGGVVGAGEPQGGVARHTLVADQDILEGVVQGVTHVELARNVGRRDDDGVGLLVGIAVGGEIALVHPILVDPVLKFGRGVCLGKLGVGIHGNLLSDLYVEKLFRYPPSHPLSAGALPKGEPSLSLSLWERWHAGGVTERVTLKESAE